MHTSEFVSIFWLVWNCQYYAVVNYAQVAPFNSLMLLVERYDGHFVCNQSCFNS